MKCIVLAVSLSSSLFIASAQAAPNTFFDKLSGKWSGAGTAYVTKFGELSAKCRLAVIENEARVSMEGSCGFFVFRKALGLSIRSVGGNKYVGTYTGSKTGPAQLDGTLIGDRLVMNIKWGGIVNGDRAAQLILERTGPNSFTQTVSDRVEGKRRSTSSFAFVRR